jgi:uncharacterized protein YbaA (DUF1428 family)
MPTQDNLQERQFSERLQESKIWTQMMATVLKAKGHITDFRQANVDEDKNQLVDYWFTYPAEKEEVPVAFKLRIDPAKRDIPVVYSQPFYGVNSERTVIGRDYRCVVEGMPARYYVAVKNAAKEYNEVYWMTKEKLKGLITDLISAWKTQESSGQLIRYEKLTEERVQSLIRNADQGKCSRKIALAEEGEVWWQKNRSEKFSKVNLYFPESVKEGSIFIPPTTYQNMLRAYKQYLRNHEN